MHFNVPEKMSIYEANDGVYHLAFEWVSETMNRVYWSTVCLDHDSLRDYEVDNRSPKAPTCVRCIAGVHKP